MPSAAWFARTTMATAFQRMKARIRRSMSSSPGNHGWSAGGMVLRYGVVRRPELGMPNASARASIRARRKLARGAPSLVATASSESTHSAVSMGSTSGSCCRKPSELMVGGNLRDRSVAAHLTTTVPRVSLTTEPGPIRVVYTDGACRGNPGPGGWAWALDEDRFASGFDVDTTNQRMEILAAYQAVRSLDGLLEVRSDSTYVVNCFVKQWHRGWHSRGWLNSQKQPVANRDLWEPFIDLVLGRGDVRFTWVKGHSTDTMNQLVDRLAVEASRVGEGRTGGDFEFPVAPERPVPVAPAAVQSQLF